MNTPRRKQTNYPRRTTRTTPITSTSKNITLLSSILSTCSLLLSYGGYAACDFIRLNVQSSPHTLESYGLFCSFPNIDKIYILCRSFAIFSLLSGFISTLCSFGAWIFERPASFPCMYIITALLQLGSMGVYFTKEVSGYTIIYKSVGIGTWIVLSSFVFQGAGIVASLILQRMENGKEILNKDTSMVEEDDTFWNVVSSAVEEEEEVVQSVSTITDNSASMTNSRNSSELYSNDTESHNSLTSSEYSKDDMIPEEEETVRRKNGVGKIVWMKGAKSEYIGWPSDESTGDSVSDAFCHSV